ncbi:GDSL esterase/lipase 1-like [Pistacia vera]|uniref:GDSL esterase/lipase 1-like n=1 Tax=Pistacia vera TaxID=55513 RepID=UPI001263A176|nr:GDSL esterase/lipase 1-like [Pistacia vera]
MTRLSLVICFVVLCLSLVISIIRRGHLPLPTKHVALFIFGDSHFDAGNNNYINTTTYYQANFWPFGKTFFNYPTGRFSDGRLTPDFIAEYAKLPLISPYLQSSNHQSTSGVNFASAGAGVLSETHQGLVIDLRTQLSYFNIVEKQLKQKLGDEGAKTFLSKAVYLISVGSNDYSVIFTTNPSVHQFFNSRKEYVETVIGNVTTIIREIYKKGGRKFGFLNLGPLGCIPSMKVLVPDAESIGSCLEEATETVKLHNKELSKVLLELESELQGFRYANHDFYASLTERINNPSKYGFKEAMACCGTGSLRGILSCGGKRAIKEYQLCDNPGEYLFFDGDHLTERANKQISELMWSGAPDVTGPYNLKKLFEHM